MGGPGREDSAGGGGDLPSKPSAQAAAGGGEGRRGREGEGGRRGRGEAGKAEPVAAGSPSSSDAQRGPQALRPRVRAPTAGLVNGTHKLLGLGLGEGPGPRPAQVRPIGTGAAGAEG